MSVEEGLKIFKSHLYHAFHLPFDALSDDEKRELITKDLKGSPTLIVMGATYLDSLWRDKSKPKNLVEFRKSIAELDSDMAIYIKSVETLENNVPVSIKHMVRDLLYFYGFYGSSQDVSFPKEKQAGALKELFAKCSQHSKFYRDLSDDLFYNYFIALTGQLQHQGLLDEGREGVVAVPLLIKRSVQCDFVRKHYGKLETKAEIELQAYRKRWDSSWTPACLQTSFGYRNVEAFRKDQKLQLEKDKLVWLVSVASYIDQTAPEETPSVAHLVNLMDLMKNFHVSARLKSEILNGSRLWTLATNGLMKDLPFEEAFDLLTHFFRFISNDDKAITPSIGDGQWVAFGEIFHYNSSTKTLTLLFLFVYYRLFLSIAREKSVKSFKWWRFPRHVGGKIPEMAAKWVVFSGC